MNSRNLQFNLFDAFGFIFPGILILLACFVLGSSSTVHLTELLQPFQALTSSTIIIGVFLAYVTGFLVNSLGYKLYKLASRYLWKMPKSVQLGAEQSSYAILVREFSPRNYAHLEKWNALRAMSYNFSLSFLIIFAVAIVKGITSFGEAHLEWWGFSILSIYFSYNLMQRAFYYHKYYYEDLRQSVETLKLKDKATNEAKGQIRRFGQHRTEEAFETKIPH